jgi:uncharacterized membrane protein YbhN (UPF0104 family)
MRPARGAGPLSRGRVIGLVLTVLFLGLALHQVEPGELMAELGRVNYIWLVPSALSTLIGYGRRTLRWQVILSGAARAPFRTLFAVLIMGFATNNLLPGRLGEFWRAYLLGRKRNVRKTVGLASVFVERIFDGLILIALLGLVSNLVQLPAWGTEVQIVSAAIFLGAGGGLAILLWMPGVGRRLLGLVVSPLPTRIREWAGGTFEAFLSGLEGLRRPGVLLQATVLSVGVWLFEGASYFVLSRGVDLGLAQDAVLPAMGLTLVMINLGIMVPSAPGYVGTQEFFGKSALGVFGVNAESALALVIVSHAVQYALVTGLGVVFFAREQLSPRTAPFVARSENLRQIAEADSISAA